MDETQGSEQWLERYVELLRQLTETLERHLPVQPVDPDEPLEPSGDPVTPEMMEQINGLVGAAEDARRQWLEALQLPR